MTLMAANQDVAAHCKRRLIVIKKSKSVKIPDTMIHHSYYTFSPWPKSLTMRLPFFLITDYLGSLFFLLHSKFKWAKVIRPTKANALAQNISTNAAGCLRGAEALTITGNGYQLMQLLGVRF